MLFNSYAYLFLFLPPVLALFFGLGRKNATAALSLLIIASLFFYSYWNPAYLPLLLSSILGNYLFGRWLHRSRGRGREKLRLALGVAFNLILLGFFKYTDFFLANLGRVLGEELPALHLVLPLAISFFTFQQIAFLVDVYRDQTEEPSFRDYLLFVSFFPQLIAGPIVKHSELTPQFKNGRFAFDLSDFRPGLTLLVIGLFKKTILADGVARLADPVFAAALGGASPTFFEAWAGTLAFTFQIYFDFSGYTDMALGAARMMGFVLPINFDSPYKATGIIDFWRRWHMTLSRFLRDYLYIPLGGNRRGRSRRNLNILATMALGGLWHGAGWGFVLWGLAHGLMLLVNHHWREWRRRRGGRAQAAPWRRRLSVVLTFGLVAASWILFRSPDMGCAGRMLAGILGLNGVALPESLGHALGPAGHWLSSLGLALGSVPYWPGRQGWLALVGLLAVVWLLPNSQQWLGLEQAPRACEPQGTGKPIWSWRPGIAWGVVLGAMLGLAVLGVARQSEFLYFQF